MFLTVVLGQCLPYACLFEKVYPVPLPKDHRQPNITRHGHTVSLPPPALASLPPLHVPSPLISVFGGVQEETVSINISISIYLRVPKSSPLGLRTELRHDLKNRTEKVRMEIDSESDWGEV